MRDDGREGFAKLEIDPAGGVKPGWGSLAVEGQRGMQEHGRREVMGGSRGSAWRTQMGRRQVQADHLAGHLVEAGIDKDNPIRPADRLGQLGRELDGGDHLDLWACDGGRIAADLSMAAPMVALPPI